MGQLGQERALGVIKIDRNVQFGTLKVRSTLGDLDLDEM